jgi:hypothetical protein
MTAKSNPCRYEESLPASLHFAMKAMESETKDTRKGKIGNKTDDDVSAANASAIAAGIDLVSSYFRVAIACGSDQLRDGCSGFRARIVATGNP